MEVEEFDVSMASEEMADAFHRGKKDGGRWKGGRRRSKRFAFLFVFR